MINIQVWDQNNVNLVDAAIKNRIRTKPIWAVSKITIPELNEERRNELKVD